MELARFAGRSGALLAGVLRWGCPVFRRELFLAVIVAPCSLGVSLHCTAVMCGWVARLDHPVRGCDTGGCFCYGRTRSWVCWPYPRQLCSLLARLRGTLLACMRWAGAIAQGAGVQRIDSFPFCRYCTEFQYLNRWVREATSSVLRYFAYIR